MTSQSSRQILQVRAAIAALVSVGLVACSTPVYGATQPTTTLRFPHTHMDESVRDLIETVIVMPHTYDAETGVVWHLSARDNTSLARSDGGLDFAAVRCDRNRTEDSQRTCPPEIIIPYLVLPWALAGATYAKIRQEIQEFRDGLTDQLTRSASPPLANEVIAGDLYSQLRRVPGIDANVIAESMTVAAWYGCRSVCEIHVGSYRYLEE